MYVASHLVEFCYGRPGTWTRRAHLAGLEPERREGGPWKTPAVSRATCRSAAPHGLQNNPAEKRQSVGGRLAKPGLKALDHPNAPRDLPAQPLGSPAWREGADLSPQGQSQKSQHYAATPLRARLSRPDACGSRSGRTRSSRAEQPWPEAAASTPQASRVEASLAT